MVSVLSLTTQTKRFYYSPASPLARSDLWYAELLHWTFLLWVQAVPSRHKFERMCQDEGLLRDTAPVGGVCTSHLHIIATLRGCSLTAT